MSNSISPDNESHLEGGFTRVMERTPKKGWPVFMGLWSKDRVNPIHRREFQKSRFHQHIFAEIMSGGRGRGRGRGSGLSFNTEVNSFQNSVQTSLKQ